MGDTSRSAASVTKDVLLMVAASEKVEYTDEGDLGGCNSELGCLGGCIDRMGLILTTGLPFAVSSFVLDTGGAVVMLNSARDVVALEMRLVREPKERGCVLRSGSTIGMVGTAGMESRWPRITVSASPEMVRMGPVPELEPEPDECHESRFTRVPSSPLKEAREREAVRLRVGSELLFELRRGGMFSGRMTGHSFSVGLGVKASTNVREALGGELGSTTCATGGLGSGLSL